MVRLFSDYNFIYLDELSLSEKIKSNNNNNYQKQHHSPIPKGRSNYIIIIINANILVLNKS